MPDNKELREILSILRSTIGDLKHGFGRNVEPARWVEEVQALIDKASEKLL